MTAGGCLAAPTHYSAQDISATGKKHHHNTAKVLFAGFCPRDISTTIPSPSSVLRLAGAAASY